MRFQLAGLSFLVPTVALGTAFGGVVVVDPANGPGTDFTSLAAAIQAASSGDVLLLRSGIHDGSFVIAGKSLSIFADDGATVQIMNSATGPGAGPALQIGSQVSDPIIVRGLELSTSVGGGVPLVVSGASASGGIVFIEDCTVTSTATEGMRLENGSPAIVTRCFVSGAHGDPSLAPSGDPIAIGHPALIAGAGPLAIYGGMYFGGNGLPAGLYGPLSTPTPGQAGSPAVESQNTDATVKFIGGAACIGGQGGDGAAPSGSCLAPGDGGDGVLSTVNGSVFVAGLYGTGNLPGTAAPGCPSTGSFGALLDAVPPATAGTWLAGWPAESSMSAVRREGEIATIDMPNVSDQWVLLLIGYGLDFQYLKQWNGTLTLQVANVIGVGPVTWPGVLKAQAVVPELGPGVDSAFAFVQPATRNSAGVWTLGLPSAILLLDSQY